MSAIQQALPKLDTPLVQDSVGTTSDGKVVQIKGGMISIPWYRFLISLWNRTGGGVGSIGLSTGMILAWSGDINQLPSGLLLCNGQEVSREQYSVLFGIIGVKYGPGDNLTTFNLPNLQNRVPMGASATKALGSGGGNNSITLAEAQLPVVTPTINDPGHAHGQQVASNNTAGTTGTQGGTAADTTSVGTTDSAQTGITVNSFGGGQAIDITPAYLALNWVIQT